MRTIAPHSRLLRAIGLAPLILLVAYACVLTLNIGGAALENFFSTWVYNFVIAASALLCIMRAVAVPAERYVWVLVGLGLTCCSHAGSPSLSPRRSPSTARPTEAACSLRPYRARL